jgi:hypothetical protein
MRIYSRTPDPITNRHNRRPQKTVVKLNLFLFRVRRVLNIEDNITHIDIRVCRVQGLSFPGFVCLGFVCPGFVGVSSINVLIVKISTLVSFL